MKFFCAINNINDKKKYSVQSIIREQATGKEKQIKKFRVWLGVR